MDINKLIDLYFTPSHDKLYGFQLDSYNAGIRNVVRAINDREFIVHENFAKDFLAKYSLKFSNVYVEPFTVDDELAGPDVARIRGMTYSITLRANVQQWQHIINYESSASNEQTTKLIAEEKGVIVAKIPIMLRSEYCNTVIKPSLDKECRFDPGCFFIVRGGEKVVIGLERICENKMLCFTKKDANYSDGVMHVCQVNSKVTNYTDGNPLQDSLQIFSVKMRRDSTIVVNGNQFPEVPLFIFFRALGVVTDRDIINHIMQADTDTDMENLLKLSMSRATADGEGEGGHDIKTQQDAQLYLMARLKHRRYSEVSPEVKMQQKREHLEYTLNREFLPHLGTTREKLPYKARYLGDMVNKLIKTYLKIVQPDDRDSFVNKRIDMPGSLVEQLTRQYFRRMLNECSRHFKKKNNDDSNPINVIKLIKFSIIEQGLNSAMLTGTWGSSKRKGVAMQLQRLTYKQTVSHYRRLKPPPLDASNTKVVTMRHVNNIQLGFIDAIESPDGKNIGIDKHLSLMAYTTVNLDNQVRIIKQFLATHVLPDGRRISYDILDIAPSHYKGHIKVYLNGEPIAMIKTRDATMLVELIRQKKDQGVFHPHVTAMLNISAKSIHIYADAGRIIRPLLRVEDNRLLLTQAMLDSVDTRNLDGGKVDRWEEFMRRYPGVIEYVDMQAIEQLMVAMFTTDIDEARRRQDGIVTNSNTSGDAINRYNETVYVRYTHCEFHPSMMLGIISGSIPFSDHNQGPRNILNFAQARQGMGIYASNFRDRLEQSYILYHPAKPLVRTRAMSYNHDLDIPYGENMIVAIACYTGYNQEDSIIMNRTSVDRGLGRSTTLKRYSDTITKNTSTSQDDIFMRPDKSKVAGLKLANYDKLNDKGFVPEETPIESGDVIIGKVSPIQAGANSTKVYKDESEIYKSSPGVIDRVYSGIFNADGYETYNIRVRSERTPTIGDKFASLHAQKGTVGLVLSSADMPFTASGLQPDIIINPCCIPSRMTIGQLFECVFGKLAAVKGEPMDGTPFTRPDEEAVYAELKKLGFNEHGYEYLHCGMTGKKIMSKIFMGPTYYMRLKHMTQDKIHARASGPRQNLTRQPVEGRSRDGGLRFGKPFAEKWHQKCC